MQPHIWERKFEIDSIAAVVRLATVFYQKTNDSSFITENFLKAMAEILKVLEDQFKGTEDEDLEGYPAYFFQRNTEEPLDSLHHGRGHPAKKCGLV